jgi:malate dehydrogenase (oxaloacetate-decarboxylating)
VGTDNEDLLNDPQYLGWRYKRLRGEDYYAFIDKFATAFKNHFPKALCQWEDFSKQTAFTIRDKYTKKLISFNDDIQGTGSVALAGILCAMKIKKENMADQVYLVNGAGAGGIGIAEQIWTELVEQGMGEKEAAASIFAMDSKGIVTSDREIEDYKIKFAKESAAIAWLKSPQDNTLLNLIKNEKVTVLIGTSGQPGKFTKQIVDAVSANTDQPVILPLSNPTAKAEAIPQDICDWTNGKALVATGSPFEPIHHQGKNYRIGQMNNSFVFPGIGLGVVASGASEILPAFFSAAAHAVAESVSEEDAEAGILFPPLDQFRKVSLKVAKRVGAEAIQANAANKCAFSTFKHNNDPERLNTLIDKMCWDPEYLDLI